MLVINKWFKRFQNYLGHADSFTGALGARTSEGMSMREIRDMYCAD